MIEKDLVTFQEHDKYAQHVSFRVRGSKSVRSSSNRCSGGDLDSNADPVAGFDCDFEKQGDNDEEQENDEVDKDDEDEDAEEECAALASMPLSFLSPRYETSRPLRVVITPASLRQYGQLNRYPFHHIISWQLVGSGPIEIERTKRQNDRNEGL